MANKNNIHDYSDIINQPHHVSKVHPAMTMYERAAQFAPFAALTGHKDAIKETERLTTNKKILDENQIEIINQKLQLIITNIQLQPEIKIVYFQKDLRKVGGKYIEKNGKVKKIDEYTKKMILVDGTRINIEDIYAIEIIK